MEVGRPTPGQHSRSQWPAAPRPVNEPRDAGGSALARHFLARLERLAQIRQAEAERLTDEGIHLLDRTIYSSLCDCIEAGAGEVARLVLQGALAAGEMEDATNRTPVGRRR